MSPSTVRRSWWPTSWISRSNWPSLSEVLIRLWCVYIYLYGWVLIHVWESMFVLYFIDSLIELLLLFKWAHAMMHLGQLAMYDRRSTTSRQRHSWHGAASISPRLSSSAQVLGACFSRQRSSSSPAQVLGACFSRQQSSSSPAQVLGFQS
jgi:hypothetical protein